MVSFWMAFLCGVFMGFLFWCRDKLVSHSARQPAYG